jgi:hypothetical protein
VAIAPGTNTVFNTQNTAFHADLLPGMFLIPMGDAVADLTVGRHDDTWMSMFLKPIADHLGDLVVVGEPLVEQIRNEHDLFQDALVELPAMRLTNTFADVIDGLRLTGHDYLSCYEEVVASLRESADEGAFTDEEAAYVLTMTDRMRAWASVVAKLLDPI